MKMATTLKRLFTGLVSGALVCAAIAPAALASVNGTDTGQTSPQPINPLHGSIGDTNVHYTQDSYTAVLQMYTTSQTLSVWKADKAVSMLVLASGAQALQQVRATAGTFQAKDGTPLDAQITATFVKETQAYPANATDPEKVYEGTVPDGNRVWIPDILDTQAPVSMQANTVQNIWLEFAIPAEAKAGIYTGTIEVTANALEQPLAFTYNLEVLDATLPGTQDYAFDIELWQYPYSSAEYYGVEPFSQAHLNILRPHMQKYKELGGHAITASIVDEAWGGQTYSANEIHYPSMITWTKGTDGGFRFDYTVFDQWVSFNHAMGIGDKIVCYSMIPWENKITYYDEATAAKQSVTAEAGTPEYAEIWTQFLKDFTAHLDEKGWFEQVYIGIDERPNMAAVFDVIDQVKNKDGKAFKISAAMDTFSSKDFSITGRVDAVSVGSQAAKERLGTFKKFVKERNESNQNYHTTLYTCVGHFPNSFTRSMPGESYWTMLFAAKQGTNGFLRWALDAWTQDPLRDTTHSLFEAGDCFLLYPDEKSSASPTSKSSIRLEKLAEGVRDVNKLYLMMEAFPQLEKDVNRLLRKYVKDKYAAEPLVLDRSTATWAAAKTQTRLPRDMQALKDGIAEITAKYIGLRDGIIAVKKPLSTGAIALLSIGCVAAAACFGTAVGVTALKHKKKKQP